MGRWGDGEMGRRGDGEMGRRGDAEMGRWGEILIGLAEHDVIIASLVVADANLALICE
ncbi:hypothetical protein [Calothrix sp. UHCC 0171]|uniref:hypothetical protein n=1 Tax=Calothrix sp. UHCC 0171 TaxID=3110245 RepID=UPI002B1FEF5A|nr:hypothetical protein [Calothrix sp. UHCC 0171]MEA5572547.1 hypothetical protein [Calothrix sp. UHCC 0171]